MDRIVLDHMEFYGYHGCLPEERQQGQTFFVDAVLHLDLRAAGEQDNLAQTVNYADVFTKIRSIVEGNRQTSSRQWRSASPRWSCGNTRASCASR